MTEESNFQYFCPKLKRNVYFDFYHLLDLQNGASEEEIRKAYRRQALDKSCTIEAKSISQQKFKIIADAYTTLIDPNKRLIYNAFLKKMQIRRLLKKRDLLGISSLLQSCESYEIFHFLLQSLLSTKSTTSSQSQSTFINLPQDKEKLKNDFTQFNDEINRKYFKNIPENHQNNEDQTPPIVQTYHNSNSMKDSRIANSQQKRDFQGIKEFENSKENFMTTNTNNLLLQKCLHDSPLNQNYSTLGSSYVNPNSLPQTTTPINPINLTSTQSNDSKIIQISSFILPALSPTFNHYNFQSTKSFLEENSPKMSLENFRNEYPFLRRVVNIENEDDHHSSQIIPPLITNQSQQQQSQQQYEELKQEDILQFERVDTKLKCRTDPEVTQQGITNLKIEQKCKKLIRKCEINKQFEHHKESKRIIQLLKSKKSVFKFIKAGRINKI